MIVISPWSRNAGARSDPGWRPLVCSDVLDHTSQMRFLERVFAAKGEPGVSLPHDTTWRKQTVGDLTHDEDLIAEGEADEAAGQVQDAIGRGARKVGKAIEDVGKAVKRG